MEFAPGEDPALIMGDSGAIPDTGPGDLGTAPATDEPAPTGTGAALTPEAQAAEDAARFARIKRESFEQKADAVALKFNEEMITMRKNTQSKFSLHGGAPTEPSFLRSFIDEIAGWFGLTE